MSISSFFAKRRTIESITSPITSIVTKLQTHAELHAAEDAKNRSRAQTFAAREQESLNETTRAKSEAEKFARFVA